MAVETRELVDPASGLFKEVAYSNSKHLVKLFKHSQFAKT